MERQLSLRAAVKASELAKAQVQQPVEPVVAPVVEKEPKERRRAKLTKAEAKKALKEAIAAR